MAAHTISNWANSETADEQHTQDEHCCLNEDDQCVQCGVSHAGQCEDCGGRGFHRSWCESLKATMTLPAISMSALINESASLAEWYADHFVAGL